MKTWYVLKWAYQALLAELHKLYDMILTGTFYLVAEAERLWIGVNPETVSLDANNVQSTPLDIRFWSGEGSNKAAMEAYLTLCVETAYNDVVVEHCRYNSPGKVSAYIYTIPSDKYATANRISIHAYEDAARTKEVDSKQVNIIAANPTPFPRSDPWSTELVYKNGEYFMYDDDDVLYMWTSRVPGNTATDPKTWIQDNPASGLWTPYPYSTLLAGRIILGKFALIDSAVFQNGYVISQQGVDASGNPTNDYRLFGTNNFTPNLMLNFKTGDCELSGSIKRGMVVIESGSAHQMLTKNNIYVVKSDISKTLITLFFSPGSRSYGTEFSIINGGSGIVSIGYLTDLVFLFKGKQYSVVKLNKPGDIAEFIFSPMTSNAAPNMGIALVLRNKSDFKVASDGVTLESI